MCAKIKRRGTAFAITVLSRPLDQRIKVGIEAGTEGGNQ
jgi:hypothetical protein